MGAPQYEQAGADVAGSGTINTIPRWTGVTTLGDSVMVQSGTGIGINVTPAQTFHAYFASGNNGIRIESGTNTASDYAVLRFTQGGGEKAVLYTNLTQTVLKASAGSLDLWGSGEKGIRVDGSTGNVGIGTASPGAVLHTLASASEAGIFASANANSWIVLRRSTSTVLGYIGTGGLAAGGAASDLTFRSESGGLLFATGGDTERARIDTSGNIVCNTAAIATNATNGFLYVPSCAGTPTGTPTTYTGRVPIVVDTTNNKLYFYSGGAWRDAGP